RKLFSDFALTGDDNHEDDVGEGSAAIDPDLVPHGGSARLHRHGVNQLAWSGTRAVISNAIRPSRTVSFTRPPCSSTPNKSSLESGRLTSSWMTRASGRAPLSRS